MRHVSAILAVLVAVGCGNVKDSSDGSASSVPTTIEGRSELPDSGTTASEATGALFGREVGWNVTSDTRVGMLAAFVGVARLDGSCVVLDHDNGDTSVVVMPWDSSASSALSEVFIGNRPVPLGRWTVYGGEIEPEHIDAYVSTDGFDCAQGASSYLVVWDGVDCCEPSP
jgi:hypothetical protein